MPGYVVLQEKKDRRSVIFIKTTKEGIQDATQSSNVDFILSTKIMLDKVLLVKIFDESRFVKL